MLLKKRRKDDRYISTQEKIFQAWIHLQHNFRQYSWKYIELFFTNYCKNIRTHIQSNVCKLKHLLFNVTFILWLKSLFSLQINLFTQLIACKIRPKTILFLCAILGTVKNSYGEVDAVLITHLKMSIMKV